MARLPAASRPAQSKVNANRARRLTNVAADKHFSDAASPQW
jgi:hypothetical protein